MLVFEMDMCIRMFGATLGHWPGTVEIKLTSVKKRERERKKKKKKKEKEKKKPSLSSAAVLLHVSSATLSVCFVSARMITLIF